MRDENSTAFDHKYPVLGKILASEEGFDEFLSKRTFPRLLCKHTPFLWRVVDGDILYHKLHPFAIVPLIHDSLPDTQTGGSPWEGSHDHNPGGSGGLIHTDAVPEPSSWVLTFMGLVFALLAIVRRRIYRIATTWKRERTLV